MSQQSSGTPTGTLGVDTCSISHSMIDDLTDTELEKAINELKADTRRIELENMIFEHFLQKNDPSLLVGMNQAMDTFTRIQVQAQTSGSLEQKSQESVVGRSISVVKFTGTTSSAITDRGLRVNLSQKTDLTVREIEETKASLQNFIKKSHRKKCNLKAELEEIGVRQTEIEDARRVFEQTVVIDGIDSLTGKIPAEKFVRYMEEWLKSTDATIEKMRLKTSSLKGEYSKIVQQISIKEELGESIHAVDFDQLRIENRRLATKIEEKNIHLLELKKMTGTANLVLSTSKKFLQKQVEQLKSLQVAVKEADEQIIRLDKEGEKTEHELRETQEKYEHLFNMKDNYIVPEVIEYIRIVTKLGDLNKEIKVWSRKNNILHFGLSTCIRNMKIITGSKKPEKWWFSKEDAPDSIDNIFASIKPGYK